MRIADLRGEMSRVDIEGNVIDKSDVREVSLKAGGTNKIADATIKDDSGTIKLTLWGEEINNVDVGDRIQIENGYTKAFRGEVQLNVGRYGRLIKVG